MPRKKVKQPEYKVSGKSIKDLMNITPRDINSMSKENLARVVTRLSSAANKRARRMKQAGVSSPALRGMERSGGKFSSKGKDVRQLRSEYKRVKGFLSSETSSLAGYRKFIKRFKKKMKEYSNKPEDQQNGRERLPEPPTPEKEETGEGETYQGEVDDEEEDDFETYDRTFLIIDRLRELNPWLNESYMSQLTGMVSEYMINNPHTSVEDAVETLNKTLRSWYEAQAKRDENIKWSDAF